MHLRGAWQVRIRGMGDRFSNNLLHDASGQLLLPSGPLTMLDHNEVFNTGYVEGDGGVMYRCARTRTRAHLCVPMRLYMRRAHMHVPKRARMHAHMRAHLSEHPRWCNV